MPTPIPYSPASGLTLLSDITVISVTGADTVSFLQGQLTNDIKALAVGSACLAGYCTPKGRLLATMLVLKTATDGQESLLLIVPAELQEALQKRLQMFIMRAKVSLTNLSPTTAIWGISGAECAQQFAPWFPTLPAEQYSFISNASGTLLRMSDVSQVPRYQWITDLLQTHQLSSDLRTQLPDLPLHAWNRAEIHAGIPHIGLQTQEKFVPQMINYELLGGVSFKKGCYPGQEIVARTHYLGKQKRRMVLANIADSNVCSGMEVFASDDLSQPCGMIVNAQPDDAGGSDCLIEIKSILLNQVPVQLSSGAVCHWLELPYALPQDAGTENSQPAAT